MTDILVSQLKSKSLLKGWLIGREYYKALSALEFASRIHTGIRKDGVTSEFSHQIFIAQQVRIHEKNLLFPEDTLVNAFLHDILEDYDISPIILLDEFGAVSQEDALLISKEVLSDPLFMKRGNKEYYGGMFNNPRVSVIKGFDRLHNISTMKGAFSVAKMVSYIEESRDFTEPMLKEASARFPQQESVYRSIRLSLALLNETYTMFLDQIGAKVTE